MWETPGMPDVYAWRLLDVKLSATTDCMAHHQRWTATGISVRDQSGVPADFASSEWFEVDRTDQSIDFVPRRSDIVHCPALETKASYPYSSP